jgi:hypothetical protein
VRLSWSVVEGKAEAEDVEALASSPMLKCNRWLHGRQQRESNHHLIPLRRN